MDASDSGKISQSGLVLPWDLTQWFEKSRLLEWVTQEVETLNWANPTLEAYLEAYPNLRPKLLLCVISWCYATGVYESGEISRTCDVEPGLRRLCQADPPPDKAVARFRRENRGLIRWSLVQVFRRALCAKWNLGSGWFPAGLKRHLGEAATMRLDVARQMDRGSSGF